MAAAIPWKELAPEGQRQLRVLDPMSGSGTTLAVARTLGHQAIGFDTDPLAVLIARAWCQDVDHKQLREKARVVLAKAASLAAKIAIGSAYPLGADRETRAFVRYWFDPRNRRELTALATTIGRVRDDGIRCLLQCAFSRLIIAKQAGASLALDLAHSRPHRVLGKTVVRPLTRFLDEVDRVCEAAPFGCVARKPPRARIRRGDARMLPLQDESVDFVITSPPYLNGIDYQRMTKFSLAWLGYPVADLRRVRESNIGTEAAGLEKKGTRAQQAAFLAMVGRQKVPARMARMLAKYVRDMDATLQEITRVLVPRGRALIVIGDSTIRGAYVRNSLALLALAKSCGLNVTKVTRRRLPPNKRYLPPPRAQSKALDARLRTEALLHLRKASCGRAALAPSALPR
jgi:DNA modification methylase